ncbi:hypothetical protein ABKV19_013136 [Rosa sericea]
MGPGYKGLSICFPVSFMIHSSIVSPSWRSIIVLGQIYNIHLLVKLDKKTVQKIREPLPNSIYSSFLTIMVAPIGGEANAAAAALVSAFEVLYDSIRAAKHKNARCKFDYYNLMRVLELSVPRIIHEIQEHVGDLDLMEDQVNNLTRQAHECVKLLGDLSTKKKYRMWYCYHCINENPFVETMELDLDLRKLSHCLHMHRMRGASIGQQFQILRRAICRET